MTPRAERLVRATALAWVPVAVTGFAVLALVVGIPAGPEGTSLTSRVESSAQLVLLAVAAAGWAVGLRWDAVGAALLAVAGSLLGVLAALAHTPAVSPLVATAFLAPAFGLWLVWQRRRTVRAVALLGVVTALLLGGTWAAASVLYDHYYGPAHPESGRRALPVDRVVWAWTGGVTARAVTVVAELAPGTHSARVGLRPVAGGAVVSSPVVEAGADHVVRMSLDGLAPGTGYAYRVEVDGVADTSRGVGRVATMPDGPASFSLAFGACARTGSNGAVFDAIAATDPLLYVAVGDLHYGNPARPDVSLFGNLYRRVLTAPSQAALYREVPVAYVWDDHDYGPDDADSTAPTRTAATAAYERYVPHHPLAGGGISQAFTVGRVRVVLTDTRSERTDRSMLGQRQLAWLERELVTAAHSHAVVVWVNPDPWVGPARPGADDWSGYADERRRLSDVLAGAGVRNLVMVAGDAHMVAVDDGLHTDYSSSGGGGFPLLHAAALDRPGGVKGGPYSGGAYPGAGQFGTVTVTDDGGPSVTVTLAGRNWRGEVLTSHELVVDVP